MDDSIKNEESIIEESIVEESIELIGEENLMEERHHSPNSLVTFRDSINLNQDFNVNPVDPSEVIDVTGGINIFAYKYSNKETDLPGDTDTPASNGDNVGFTLVFGNYGDLTYSARPNCGPTVEDTLRIPQGVTLTLMNYCTCNDLRLYKIVRRNGHNCAEEVQNGDVFTGGTYRLQIRKVCRGKGSNNNSTPYFDLPAHTMYSLSMLFEVGFDRPSCHRQPR